MEPCNGFSNIFKGLQATRHFSRQQARSDDTAATAGSSRLLERTRPDRAQDGQRFREPVCRYHYVTNFTAGL